MMELGEQLLGDIRLRWDPKPQDQARKGRLWKGMKRRLNPGAEAQET